MLKNSKNNLFSRDNLLVRLNNWMRRKLGVYYRRSYSQCGEDIIVKTIFDMIGIGSPSYLDVGAHHPCYLNNTYILYCCGARGINIEPDPLLCSDFQKFRPHDVNLNVGVAKQPGVLDLNIMSSRTLNTFVNEEALEYERQGYKIERKISVPVVTINQLLNQYGNKAPEFLSIDVEGLDYEILNSLDFETYRPIVICVETIVFSNTGAGVKRIEIDALVESKGYFKFADTYINTIYVDVEVWKHR